MHNQERTEFFGYNMAMYKIKIFTISGGLAGLAGALFVSVTSFVSPSLIGFIQSAEVLIWVALGGRHVLLASLLGAIAVRSAEAVLSDIMVYYWVLFLGLLFVLSVLFFPKGIFGHFFRDQ
jgi:branched-chain amino acid transport system permease protein/urea transport system permease protein